MMKREFTAVYEKRGKHFVAWLEEVPGVNTQGRTKKEVRENLKEALTLVVEANRTLAERERRHTFFREPLRVLLPSPV